MNEVRFFAEALEEIEHERSWYADRSAASEAAFLRELDHGIESIAENPKRWPTRGARVRRYVFPTFPFSFIYFDQ